MASRNKLIKGLANPGRAIRWVLRNPVIGVTSRRAFGTHVLDRDWDALVLLDTCRVDALRSLSDEYGFLDDVGRIWSLGGSSPEWIAHTFDRGHSDTLVDTAYLNVNAWAERILEDGLDSENPHLDHSGLKKLYRYGRWNVVDHTEIGMVEHVWKQVERGHGAWAEVIPDEYLHGRAPPRYLTDAAIRVGRDHDFERLILHYTQPHAPYIATAMEEGRDLHEHEREPFDYARRTGDRSTVYARYLDELRFVLDDVELLLENLDANRVVISSDHGEAFGEYGTYGHHAGSLNPYIRYVPWGVTTARDTGSHEPQRRAAKTESASVEQALEALGYKT
jgi:hypothetical protein